jgi:hypothetical protein
MATVDPNRQEMRWFTLDGGVDTGSAPDLILDNQAAQAINVTFRGGKPTCRPPFMRRRLVFDANQTKYDFEDGFFQGAGTFTSDQGNVYLVASISGKLFTTEISAGLGTKQLVIPGLQNNPTLQKAWFCQAENTLIVQDNESRPVFWDGATIRRAADDEVPVGGPTTYGQGRVWVAQGRAYVGGDIVNGDPTYGRQNVLRFTENEYLNEGGSFSVPRTDTNITALNFVAAQDEAQGTSGLMVFTRGGVYQFDAPTDRETWKNLQQPLQRFALLEYGALSHESVSLVNGDMFFRAPDGIRSFKYARREFTGWGNTPISDEVLNPVDWDSGLLLDHASSVNFDNRLIMTAIPQLSPRGIWHMGLVVLDFKLISKMNRQAPPVWDGTWTGMRTLQVLTVEVFGVKKCFAYALDADLRICLYEILPSGDFDNGDTRIDWTLVTRELSPDIEALWRLRMCEVWLTGAIGTVNLDFSYRPDQIPCWNPLHDWSECVTKCYPGDSVPCTGWQNYQPMTLPRRSTPEPRNEIDLQLKRPYRDGYGFQVRMEMSGKFTLSKGRLVTSALVEPVSGTIIPSPTCP